MPVAGLALQKFHGALGDIARDGELVGHLAPFAAPEVDHPPAHEVVKKIHWHKSASRLVTDDGFLTFDECQGSIRREQDPALVVHQLVREHGVPFDLAEARVKRDLTLSVRKIIDPAALTLEVRPCEHDVCAPAKLSPWMPPSCHLSSMAKGCASRSSAQRDEPRDDR